ncbi:protein kinase [Streptomyces sp. 900105755]
MSENGSGGRVQPARPGDPTGIGPYRIVGRLGAGGMGTVHAGVTSDGMRVAVKVVHPEHAQDPGFRARFRREVQLSSRVAGPHLVPLLAADPDAPTPWLATAYVPGPTLNQKCSPTRQSEYARCALSSQDSAGSATDLTTTALRGARAPELNSCTPLPLCVYMPHTLRGVAPRPSGAWGLGALDG